MCRRASVHVCVCLNYNVVHVRESLSILLLLSDYLHPLAFNSGQPLVKGSAAIAYEAKSIALRPCGLACDSYSNVPVEDSRVHPLQSSSELNPMDSHFFTGVKLVERLFKTW